MGFGFNVEYKAESQSNSNLVFIPKLGLGNNFFDRALNLQVGFAVGSVLKKNLLKVSSDIGFCIKSPFYPDGHVHGDEALTVYETGDALYWHIGPEYEWQWGFIHLGLGIGPLLEISNPFKWREKLHHVAP
jgi:hypothetical protein